MVVAVADIVPRKVSLSLFSPLTYISYRTQTIRCAGPKEFMEFNHVLSIYVEYGKGMVA